VSRHDGASVTDPAKAVFLSYASQDAQAAQKICEALRAAGIPVFFDRSELRGGDAWDQKIRHQIHDCALFMPVVSQHTQERLEGYFRLEWKLAVDRSHLMATERPFLVPVVVDGTRDQEAFVPDAFRALQWTRLPGGDTPPAFAERIKRLLSPELSPLSAVSGAAAGLREPVRATWRSRPVLLAIVAVVVCAVLAYFVADKFWISKHLAASTAFAPPPHSIAVLPFVNLSGDKEQEYFSDGLTEELLNSLAEIDGLQVAARTSSFTFKEHPDIATVAHKLNVGAVLEGSVRRSANTIRITAQLINAVTGFQLWSKTYDRNLGDVLKLQTEIATAVANSLKVTLLGDVSVKIELGGTRNPAAFDAYLRGLSAFRSRHGSEEIQNSIAAYGEAIRLDPNYALAFAARSTDFTTLTLEPDAKQPREGFTKAEADAHRALALAPDLGQAHMALAYVSERGLLNFAQARDEYQRAVTLAPGNADVLRLSGTFATYMGQLDAGLVALRRAVVLDPLARSSYSLLGNALYVARRYGEATTALTEAISVNPGYQTAYGARGRAFYGLGDFEKARSSCEMQRDNWLSQWCLALVYEKLGRHADAQAELAKQKAARGDEAAYQYATIYAQWGNHSTALEWLSTAMRLHDSDLIELKTDPLMDPLRKEPRFQAIERELKFSE